MARLKTLATRKSRKLGPIGTVCALITASVVTLIGVACGLEPYIILIRATTSALIVGITMGFGLSVIQLANTPPRTRT